MQRDDQVAPKPAKPVTSSSRKSEDDRNDRPSTVRDNAAEISRRKQEEERKRQEAAAAAKKKAEEEARRRAEELRRNASLIPGLSDVSSGNIDDDEVIRGRMLTRKRRRRGVESTIRSKGGAKGLLGASDRLGGGGYVGGR